MPAESANAVPDFAQLICIGFASGLSLSSELYANVNMLDPLVSTNNFSRIRIGEEKELSCPDQLQIRLSL
jgi:hypothetical protein